MRLYLVLFLGLFFNINGVFAGTIDPGVSDTKYVEFGKEFKSIGKISGIYQNGIKFSGSGVVISPNVILTAAHVVQNYKTVKVTVEQKDYEITKCIWPKEFDDNTFGKSDIAICYSIEPIKLDFYPPLYDHEDESGKICTLSGYGMKGTFITGALNSDSERRAGSNKIDYIEKDLLMCSPSRPNDKDKTALEFLIGSGDSGGGLFIGNKLAGIHSCVMWDTKDKSASNSRYGSESGHTRVSKYRKWILENSK
ncbi:MAG: hypothetical protein EBS93_07615 [Chitinophagia bacterium]|nr:hypothetical protein [Chitinophagia bacterium]NCA30567.1 hypothetical protein [Chitinophagia bacterium]